MRDKPVYRVGAAGLDPRDWRLIEIVFRHSQYNRFEFRLVARIDADAIDVLIANPGDPDGVDALACIGEGSRRIPVIEAVPRGGTATTPHAISIERLTLQLLPVLNRVVELEVQGGPGVEVTGTSGLRETPELRESQEQRESSDGRTGDRGPEVDPGAPVSVEVEADHAQGGDEPSAPNTSATGQPMIPAADAPAPWALGRPEMGLGAPLVPLTPAGHGVRDASPLAPATVSRPHSPASSAPASMSSPVSPSPVSPAASAQAPAAPSRPPSSERASVGAAARSNLVAFPRQNAGERGVVQALRVLVVDDSPTVRRQLALAFDRLGLECEPVDSAAEALSRLEEGHFDLILVDVVMPDMDGYRLTREIKRNRRLRGTPVIILTSRSSPFDLARGALAGCDTYLTKPVPFRALEKAVVRQLRRSLAIDDLSGLVRSAAEPAAHAPEQPSPAGSRPLARVARLFGR